MAFNSLGTIKCGTDAYVKKELIFQDDKLSLVQGAYPIISFHLNKKFEVKEFTIKDTIIKPGEQTFIIQNEKVIFMFLYADYNQLKNNTLWYQLNYYNELNKNINLSGEQRWLSLSSYFLQDPHDNYPITDLLLYNPTAGPITIKSLIIYS